jgi:thioredoxin-like negative regulator of GroEL
MSTSSRRIPLVAAFLWSAAVLFAAETQPPASARPAAIEDPWQTRLPAFSLDAPPRADSPILLYFTADWCGFCKQMERTTLAEPAVRARVGEMRAHKLDFDEQGGLVKRFGIRGIPAFVLTNDRGDVIDRLTGARSKEDFLRWLDQAGTDFTRHAQTAAVRAEALRTLPAEARSADAAVRAKALDALWTLAGRGDEAERATAAAQLTELTAKESAAWRAGLGHVDLAVRVAAANLLRTISEGRLSFDPWAEEATREAALAALRF